MWKIAFPIVSLSLKTTHGQLVNLISPVMTITTSRGQINNASLNNLIDGDFDTAYDAGLALLENEALLENDWVQIYLGAQPKRIRTISLHVNDQMSSLIPAFNIYVGDHDAGDSSKDFRTKNSPCTLQG